VKYLPGADLSRLYDSQYPGATWPDGPDVILFHTTETTGLPGYSNGGSAPNATFDIKRRKVWQHFSCNRSSRALVDAPGGAITNRSRVFQIELVCYSDRNIARSIGRDDLWVGNLTDDDMRWVAAQVAPLVKAYPIPFVLTPRFTKTPKYGVSAPQRMTAAEWGNFAGWTGHAYAPENSHWDPGALDIPKLMAYCKAMVGVPDTDDKDWFDMATEADLRRIVREELSKIGDLQVGVPYGEHGDTKPLGFILASTQHRVRELTRAVFGTPDIVEGQEPVWPEGDPGEPVRKSARDLFAAGGFSGDDLDVALAVAYLESGGYVDAVGDLHMVGKDGVWGPSVGLFQMLTMQNPPVSGYVPDTMRDIEKLRDPAYQVQAAKALVEAKGWGQWTMHPDSGKRDNYEAFHARVGVDFDLLTGHERAACWSLTGCPDSG
jgi:hypothetical protein